jgi:hypothetical protein
MGNELLKTFKLTLLSLICLELGMLMKIQFYKLQPLFKTQFNQPML